ncbi:hypothetical protein ACK323_20630 [Aeromonas enteropelogenes]|uniref:hypothetical protein n=1 Tax=Aeromonas enteropelogenes TaxID=29489 RepID=UPI0039890FE3
MFFLNKVLFFLGVMLLPLTVYSAETNKNVYAQFTGLLGAPSNVAEDVTTGLVSCASWSQNDCYAMVDGEKINAFGTGPATSQDLIITPGMVGQPFRVKFDSQTRPVDLFRADGAVVRAYFKIVGVSFQVNGNPPWETFSYSDGTPWTSSPPDIIFGGDCTKSSSHAMDAQNKHIRIYAHSNKEGISDCPASNMYYNPLSVSYYTGQNAFFLYRLTTDDVRAMEPGTYTTRVPVRYTIGQGENIDLYEGRITRNTLPTAHNINITLEVSHDMRITGSVSSVKLYPGTAMSWERWRRERTPLKNDIHFRMASTGPARISVFCKDAITGSGECALRRRLPSTTATPGAIDPADSKLYGIKLFLTVAGYTEYYSGKDLQMLELKPSTRLATSSVEPTSSITVVPTTSESMVGTVNIETLPGVSEMMENGRTYAGTVTLVFEPGVI